MKDKWEYKVGDLVRILNREESRNRLGRSPDFGYNETMNSLAGNTVRIDRLYPPSSRVKLSSSHSVINNELNYWTWSIDMLEPSNELEY